jgi:hypothetical protein
MATKPTIPRATPSTGKRRGRRPNQDHWTKVTVVLLDQQIVFLDRLASDIRGSTGAAITRAHILRALVDALAASDVDLTMGRTEADLKSLLTQRFGPLSSSTRRVSG